MKTTKIRLLLLALACSPGISLGLSEDNDQPMLIEADSAELDDKKGISIYKGNVKVTQGTLVLTGEIMTVHNNGDDISKVIVEGSPATYRQRPDGKDNDINAQALADGIFQITGKSYSEQGGTGGTGRRCTS